MRSAVRLIRPLASAAVLAIVSLLPLGGCAIPPSGIPAAASIRGLKPSGYVTMNQAFVAATGVGSGTLAFRGRTYPFILARLADRAWGHLDDAGLGRGLQPP